MKTYEAEVFTGCDSTKTLTLWSVSQQQQWCKQTGPTQANALEAYVTQRL